METRGPPLRITTAEWIERQRREKTSFVRGRPYIVILDEITREPVYQRVVLIDKGERARP